MGGLTLGGGYGWLSGQYGLVVDNLLSARLVLADGRVVEASESSNPELFWAVRGAGHNFGVAVSLVILCMTQRSLADFPARLSLSSERMSRRGRSSREFPGRVYIDLVQFC